MELGTTDPMTGDKKKFFFYPLLAISLQKLSWLDRSFKHGCKKVPCDYDVGHLDIASTHMSITFIQASNLAVKLTSYKPSECSRACQCSS